MPPQMPLEKSRAIFLYKTQGILSINRTIVPEIEPVKRYSDHLNNDRTTKYHLISIVLNKNIYRTIVILSQLGIPPLLRVWYNTGVTK